MIDTANGFIKLSSYTLTPHLQIAEFKKFSSDVVIVDLQTGWKWTRIKHIKHDAKTFNFRVGLYQNRLKELCFVFDTEDTAKWDPWNRTTEFMKLNLYRSWLNSEIGDRRSFNWGIIEESFDKKAGLSAVRILYHRKTAVESDSS